MRRYIIINDIVIARSSQSERRGNPPLDHAYHIIFYSPKYIFRTPGPDLTINTPLPTEAGISSICT